MAYAAALVVVYAAVDLFFQQALEPAAPLLEAFLSGSLWGAVAVAILKYRLYEIDFLINRTLVYGSLTAMLALMYFR